MIFPVRTEVLISGAGPVGLLSACLLGKYGISCVVIDKNPEPLQIPRAIALDDETLRILQVIGLDQAFRKISKKAAGLQLCNQQGKPLFTLTKKAVSGKDASFLFHSPSLEKLLREKLNSYKEVQLIQGAKLIAFQQKGDYIENQVAFDLNKYTLNATFLIGSDGANSLIRQEGNFGWQNYGYTATNFKMDIALKNPRDYSPFIKKFIGPNKRAYVFLDSWGTHKRVEFSLPNSKDKNFENYYPKLKKILGTSHFTMMHQALYTFKSGLAKLWLKDNIALVGDAAHLMPPYIGQGMCAGFRDAHNLTSKLFLIKKQNYKQQLLTTYQQERKPHTRFVLLLTIITGLLFISPLRFLLFFIGYLLPKPLRKFEAPPIRLQKGNFYKGKLAGHLFPQFNVYNRQGEEILSDECLHQGFTMVLFIKKGENYHKALLTKKSITDALTILNMQVLSIYSEKPASEPEGNYCIDKGLLAPWFQQHKYAVLILRPDRYIYAACKINRNNDAETIIKTKQLLNSLMKWVK